jgi:hypothetical protein
MMKAFRSELDEAARHFGAEIPSAQHQALYKLAIAWMPNQIGPAVDAAIQLLPEFVRHWAFQTSSKLFSASPLQMLFVQHVSAVRSTT